MQLLVESLLRKSRIQFDAAELHFQMESHPSYPSLHAVTGVLDHFNITNVAARVPKTMETLKQLPLYFIAQLKSMDFDGLFFVEQRKEMCVLLGEDGVLKKISTQDFMQAFTGILLATEKSDEPQTWQSFRSAVPLIGLVTAIALMAYLFLLAATNWAAPWLLLSSIFGVGLSMSAIYQEMGVKNRIGETFCNNGPKTNCATVLNSKGATMPGAYKLSDASLMYFMGLSLSILFLTFQNQNLFVLLIISAFSIPVTLYSIYYQVFKVRTWCLLCLGIIGILWIQAGILLFHSFWSGGYTTASWQPLILMATGFSISLSVWYYLKPGLKQLETGKQYKVAFYKFKRNASIFQFLMKQQRHIATPLSATEDMVFGNPHAELEILLVTNPFCRHCKPLHSIIEQLLTSYKQSIRLIIRFNINLSDVESDLYLIVARLLDIYRHQGSTESLQALHDIYQELSPKDWLDKWLIPGKKYVEYFDDLHAQKHWSVENKINFTPALLINGYEYPKAYEHDDLLFMIDAILADDK